MQHEEKWRPTKFITKKGELISNKTYVGVRSHYMASRQARAYGEAVQKYVRGDLIDIGCGMAPLHGFYRSYVSSIACVDQSGSQSPYVDRFADLSQRIPYADAQFDTVMATDVIAHISNYGALYSEAYRILRSGGHLIIGSPFLYCICPEPADYYRFTRHAYQEALGSAGFEVREVLEYGGLPDVLLDLISKVLSDRVPLISDLWAYLAVCFGRFGPLRRIADKTKATYPLGYVVVGRRP